MAKILLWPDTTNPFTAALRPQAPLVMSKYGHLEAQNSNIATSSACRAVVARSLLRRRKERCAIRNHDAGTARELMQEVNKKAAGEATRYLRGSCARALTTLIEQKPAVTIKWPPMACQLSNETAQTPAGMKCRQIDFGNSGKVGHVRLVLIAASGPLEKVASRFASGMTTRVVHFIAEPQG
nr:uncharacterized protein CTRU02_00483 [Colletotrichum truncatum]KAF6801733.1 hypothetical protein CTRU02_00483 [Colletotrichum truncatum]